MPEPAQQIGQGDTIFELSVSLDAAGGLAALATPATRDARSAYRSVDSVSSRDAKVGATHAIKTVAAVPPNESCNKRVSFESL